MADEFDLFGNKTPPEEEYDLDSEHKISVSALRKAGRETQIEAMKHWFYSNFEDPIECCPYDSEEGGYQYIYGGPYEPLDVLREEFGGIVDNEAIEELAHKLNDISWEWSGRSDLDRDRDDYLFESVTHGAHFQSFSEAIMNIRLLAKVNVDVPQEAHFLRLLYLSVITALEAYFFEAFTKTVLADKTLLRKFFEKGIFLKEKIPVKEAFQFVDNCDKHFKEHFVNFVWHRVSSVSSIFSNVLDVNFTVSDSLDEAIRIRHDIVHRNGKTEAGQERIITRKTVADLAEEVEILVNNIESQITSKISSTINPAEEPLF